MEQIRRRQFLIKRQLQLKIALSTFMLILLSTGCVWFLMNLVVQHATHNYWNIPSFLTKSTVVIWIFIIADAIAAFLISLFFSHYIAGPIYRFEKALGSLLTDEQQASVILRKHDSLKETASILNEVIARWHEMRDELDRMKGPKS